MPSRRAVPHPDDGGLDRDGVRRLLDAVPTGGRVLQVGPGPQWDVDVLEARGVAVHRTDVTTDDLGGPYDAVVAPAVLHHVDRTLVPSVLGRVAASLEPGGAFLVSVREGDGELREAGGSGCPDDSRSTVLWREPDLCDALEDAGFELDHRAWGEDSEGSRWLTFLARRAPGPGDI